MAFAHGQEYRFRQYRVEDGLPSDIIKAVAQDTLGFFWIATDDGLVKYDGFHFQTYKNAFVSQYTKGFLNTRDGRLLAIGDLDLIEIQNRVDTVYFKTLIRGTRSPTDSTLWYAKSIFEDSRGMIWIGEPQSVLAYQGKSFNRFDFGITNRSPVFVRSFSFFEDDRQNLYTVSYFGKVYRYDTLTRSFLQLKQQLPPKVNHVLFVKGKLWIATIDGLYTATVQDKELHDIHLSLPITNASHLLADKDQTVWISTFGKNLYHVQRDSTRAPKPLPYNFNGINRTYQSHEGDLWMSTDKGLVLAQQNQFSSPDANSESHFIEGLAHDANKDHLYYCYKEALIELQPGKDNTWLSKTIYQNTDSYFQGLQFGKRGLWASSAFDVMLFENGKVKQEWDFTEEGNFVHDIFLDSHQNLWLSQARSDSLKVILDHNLQVKRYKIPLDKESEINLVREGKRGIYVGSNGVKAYLFLKEHNSSEFRNISLPIRFKVISDFNIHDIAIQNDVLWIASTEGLLRYDHKTIKRIDLNGPLTYLSVSSVEILNENNILFSNSFGLLRYDVSTGEYWLYDENAGLPSNTIINQGILIDNHQRLWVGTSFGLAQGTQSILGNKPTLKPYCIDVHVNGERKDFMRGLRAPYGSFIHFQFSPITFPENKITMQYRLDDDEVWHTFEDGELSLTDISFGDHMLHVRARKNTGLGWSAVNSMPVSIGQPYWLGSKFVLGFLVIAALIASVSYSITSRIMKKRREYLQQLVAEKTHDLQKANDELIVRNSELDRFVYSTSHDLSAPLKSILGLIMVARLDKDAENQGHYLSMMESSVRKLEEFIAEVVSYSRNSRLPIRLESFAFKEFVANILHDHQYSPNYNKILFVIDDSHSKEMVSDITRMKIVVNNLISNAIKFCWLEGGRKPYVGIRLNRTETHYILTVEDNGIGIEQRYQARIFDMFYRAHEDAQGSGLGLYILKESIIKLGGTVEAHSVHREGTTFTIILPAQEPTVISEPSPDESPEPEIVS
jgi:signal transduction histidine kinase